MATVRVVVELTREEERLQEKLRKEQEMWDNYRKNLAAKKENNKVKDEN